MDRGGGRLRSATDYAEQTENSRKPESKHNEGPNTNTPSLQIVHKVPLTTSILIRKNVLEALVVTELFVTDVNQKCSLLRKPCSLQPGARSNRTRCKRIQCKSNNETLQQT